VEELTNEELERIAQKGHIKRINGLDDIDEFCQVLDEMTKNFTIEEHERIEQEEKENVERIIGEKLSPFYMKWQEQAVRAVKLTYKRFKTSYDALLANNTERQKEELQNSSDIMLSCSAFMAHMAIKEFGVSYEEIPELSELMTLHWETDWDKGQQLEHVENVIPQIGRYIDIAEKALAERDEETCKRLAQCDLMICLMLYEPVKCICAKE
jgi:hypothetical protein